MEGEVDTGAEAFTKTATPALVHITTEQGSQLLQVFQKELYVFAADPDRTALTEHVIRLKED